MRISDWSSDVCFSDLRALAHAPAERGKAKVGAAMNRKVAELETDLAGLDVIFLERRDPVAAEHAARGAATRSVFDQLERGVGVAHHETALGRFARSEEQTAELQSLMRLSYAVLCLK